MEFLRDMRRRAFLVWSNETQRPRVSVSVSRTVEVERSWMRSGENTQEERPKCSPEGQTLTPCHEFHDGNEMELKINLWRKK